MQVFRPIGVLVGMGEMQATVPDLQVIQNVRCLECGLVYAKPSGGGTVRANPGCPDCGYVGWLSPAVPVIPRTARRRSVVGLPLLRSARSG